MPEEMDTLVPISQLVRGGLRPKPRVLYYQLFSDSFSYIKALGGLHGRLEGLVSREMRKYRLGHRLVGDGSGNLETDGVVALDNI